MGERASTGQANLKDAVARTISLDTGEKRYSLNDEDRRRSSCARAAGTSSRSTRRSTARRSARACSTSASTSSTTARALLDAGQRPVLLPAEARVAPRGAALARRVLARRGAARARSRRDPRDGAHRDDPRRVRDGRDPPRARRARGGPERRPLGLHLQRDQEARPPRGVRAARPRRRDDGGAVHARVRRPARARRATGAARTRSAAWRRSSRRGAIPR